MGNNKRDIIILQKIIKYCDEIATTILHLRNIAAHEYERIRSDFLWDTMVKDIPELSKYCAGLI